MSGGTRTQQTSHEPSPKAYGSSTASVLLLRALVRGATELGLSPEQLSELTQGPSSTFSARRWAKAWSARCAISGCCTMKLCAGTFYGKYGSDQAQNGWRLEPGSEPRPRLIAREAAPEWLPKLLAFSAEC